MKQRNFGLDIVRAGAILLVLLNHSINYFASFPLSQPIGDLCGIYGVEIFFVLSGFLIGQIYFRDVLPKVSKHSIKTFYIRRWMRTLPLYYLLLIVFILKYIFLGQSFNLHLFHFVFLQNFIPHGLDFFSVSWSLAIEEWFYLLLPLFALVLYKRKSPTEQLKLIAISILIIISIKVFILSFVYMPFESVRRVIPFRFDSLLIGVLLAGIKLYSNKIYTFLQKPSHVAVISVLLGMALYTEYVFYTRQQLDTSHFAKMFSLPLMSMLLASLLPFMEGNSVVNIFLPRVSFLKSCITRISFLSYSTYLVHLEIFDSVRTIFRNKIPLISMLPIALCITAVFSYLLYTYFEKPFMDMRKNFG